MRRLRRTAAAFGEPMLLIAMFGELEVQGVLCMLRAVSRGGVMLLAVCERNVRCDGSYFDIALGYLALRGFS